MPKYKDGQTNKPQPKLEQMHPADLIPYARNAKKHDPEQVAKIAGSIREFGFNNPVLVDQSNGIIAGHGRVMAAIKLGLESVPVIRLSHLSETQRRAYILADNKLAELGGGWDEEMLRVELEAIKESDLDHLLTGFSDEEMATLLAEPNELNGDPDEVPETPEDPITKPGDLWILGEHRLMCGDSTKAEGFGDHCETLFFDPPWDAGIAMQKRHSTLAFCDGQRISDIVELFGAPSWAFVWDCLQSWFTPSRPLKRMKMCMWYGDVEKYNQEGSHYGEPGVSGIKTNSRGTYHYEADPRGKHLADVFSLSISQFHYESEHSHSKPIDWIRMLIANCTQGDIFDPFLGSGTTLIAAEQLGRRCFGMEISPAYCDVIVKRWETLTGKKATRAADVL